MTNIDLKKLFTDLQNQMLSELQTQSNILHAPSKGDATEDSWLKWFKKYLPKRYTADRAFVIDHEGNLSEQIDIVVYDTHYCPIVFDQSGVKYITAESVYAIFEIKQELNTEHIKYATQKIQSVRRLKRTSVPIHHAGGTFECKRYHNIIGGLLTTRSAFKDMDGNIEKNLKNLDIEKRIDIICCLNKVSYIIDYLDKKITLNKNKSNEVLIFMFLEFLLRLQKLGTVPAMDFLLYAKAIDSI